MKAEEKKAIYNLLKAADSCYHEYQRSCMTADIQFTDDEISEHKTETKLDSVESKPASVTNSGVTVDEIAAKISRCTKCQLARTRNNVVPGTGVLNPLVMVIGEGPGYDEDMQGLPFVGKAGMLLDKMLAAIQLDRKTNCYIANIVKCRPPNNRDPAYDEIQACFPYLQTQIHVLKPKMIICMGRIAGQTLLNTEMGVGQLREKFFDYNGIPVMVTYHPSALLRNETLKRPAWNDLKMFRKKLTELTAVQN